MSAYTTLYITRSKAKGIFLRKAVGELSDAYLERFMDDYLEERLYNCIIVPDDDGDNNDEMVY